MAAARWWSIVLTFALVGSVAALVSCDGDLEDESAGDRDPQSEPATGLRGEYFGNPDLTDLKLTRVDPRVNFAWGSGAPHAAVGADTFSVRWTGTIVPRYSEAYTFETRSDDGVRLWIDGRKLIDNWTNHGVTSDRGTIVITAGSAHQVRLEYYENQGLATMQLFWSSAQQPRELVPQSQLLPPAATSPVQRQGRWLTYKGQHTYFVGVDAQQLAADPALDYVSILDQFKAYRINKVRIWADAYFNPSYLRPWPQKSGKFDLDAWNSTYWKRVRDFVAAARARDIIVEVTIFAIYPSKPNWWKSSNYAVAWNRDFNVNGVFSTNGNGHFYPEFYHIGVGGFPLLAERSSSGKSLRDYQQALVDKTVAELGSFPNVYFEVCNEFFEFATTLPGGYSIYPWQQHWTAYLSQKTSRLVTAHVHDATSTKTGVTGVEYFWNRADVDVLNFHLYNTNPNKISNLLHSSQGKNKVLQCNESFEWFARDASRNGYFDPNLLETLTREAWGWFLSGGYYAIYNGQHTEIAGWATMAARVKAMQNLVDKVRFWEMSPVDSAGNEFDGLVSQGPGASWQVLANPGSQVAVGFWGSPSTTPVKLRLPSGSYQYSWYDPRNAATLASGMVQGGNPATIPAPPTAWNATAGVVLFVLR